MARLISLCAVLFSTLAVKANSLLPADSPVKLEAFRSAQVPFSFVYGGKSSHDFLANWTKAETSNVSEGGETHRFTFVDPVTHLEVAGDFLNLGLSDKRLAANVGRNRRRSFSGAGGRP